ncbi:MAG: hypothetical protein QM504_10235 [Pseudomonadota bacterium]
MTEKRKLSQDAQVAKLCRDYCKSIGVKASVTSDAVNSMVHLDVKDQAPNVVEQIKSHCNKYQWGDFGHEYKSDEQEQEDIPHTYNILFSNDLSEDMCARAWVWLKKRFWDNGEFRNAPNQWAAAKNYQALVWGYSVWDMTYLLLKGSGNLKKYSDEFWKE